MADFFIRKTKNAFGKGKTTLKPTIVHKGVKTVDDLASDIEACCTFHTADVKGMVEALRKAIARQMADGFSVKVEGLGTFSPSLGYCEGVEPETEDSSAHRQTTAFCVNRINFIPESSLLNATNESLHLKRVAAKTDSEVLYATAEERLAALKSYLAKSNHISVGGYVRLTGLSNTPATRELQTFSNDASTGITTEGRGSHKLYILA